MAPEAQMDRACPAMLEAGVLDPNSQEGIDFCTDKCPYDKCIVFETTLNTRRCQLRAIEARALLAGGMSIKDISRRLRVSVRTVRRYLEEEQEDDASLDEDLPSASDL